MEEGDEGKLLEKRAWAGSALMQNEMGKSEDFMEIIPQWDIALWEGIFE